MNIALLGAGGKMGCRLTAILRHLSHYEIDYVESSPERDEQLAADGIKTIPLAAAISRAAAVLLAIPDRLIGRVTHQIVPGLKAGTIVFGLDPAAACAGVMPDRKDIT